MKTPMHRLRGSVVGVIGLGRIGACFARKAAGVGMTVIGYDPYLAALPEGVRSVSFEALLREADMQHANLRGANVEGADLRGANLARVEWEEALMSGADLTDAGNVFKDSFSEEQKAGAKFPN